MTVTEVRPARSMSVPAARRLVAAGATWTAGFAGVHAYWASGGRIGVPAGTAAIGGRPLLLAYDVGTAILLAAAAAIGLLLAPPTGGGRQRLLLVHLALVGAVGAVLRGGLGLVQGLVDTLDARPPPVTSALGDAWFTVAGVVFWVAGRRLRETALIVSASRR